jgi:YegS/Rv2252/BmrU family lipid kinase
MKVDQDRSYAAERTQCRRAILIYNPTARRLSYSQGDLRKQIRERLSNYGVDVEFWATKRSHHAMVLAREASGIRPDLIIAAGGDGTVNEVITGMANSRVPLLVLPGGTANVLAKEIGLPSGLTQSLDLVDTGVVRRIALGKVGERYFVLMAGIGVDASIVSVVHPRLKRLLGQGAFWFAGFKQFFLYSFPSFELSVGGKSYSGTFGLIGRAKSYGGPFSIVPKADLFSDQFDICLYQSASRWRYLNYFLLTAFGLHPSLPDVIYLSAETVDAKGNPDVWFQVDGELAGRLPQTFTVERDALSLIVPRSAVPFQPKG